MSAYLQSCKLTIPLVTSNLPSQANNTYTPLAAGDTFTGIIEATALGSNLAINVYAIAGTVGSVTINQYDADQALRITSTYNVDAPDTMFVFNEPIGLPFFNVTFYNDSGSPQAYIAISTFLNKAYNTNQSVVTGSVAVSNFPLDASGNLLVDINKPIPAGNNTIGSVAVTNLPIVNEGHDCVAVSVDGWTIGNSIPVVFDTDGNTIKIDPDHNTVSVDNGNIAVSNFPLDASGNLLVDINTPIPAGNNTIGAVAVILPPGVSSFPVNVVAALPTGSKTIGNVNILNVSSVYDSGIVSISPGSIYTTGRIDVSQKSVFDVYVQATGTGLDASADTFNIYSTPDGGTTLFQIGGTSMNANNPSQGVSLGLVSAAQSLLVSYNSSASTASSSYSIQIWILSKSI